MQANRLVVSIDESTSAAQIEKSLLLNISDSIKAPLAAFIQELFDLYINLHFTYLEINPLVVTSNGIHVLDVAAKLDQAAEYLCSTKWGKIEFPPPFGREAYPEVSILVLKVIFLHFCNHETFIYSLDIY